MNESHLSSLRRDPSPEFSARLRATLAAADSVSRERGASGAEPPRRWPTLRIAASLAGVGLVGALVAVPAVRASAVALLAKFRVVNFVAVDVDAARVEQLRSGALDLPDLIGGQVQILQDPGAPQVVGSPDAAGALAGFDVREPSWLPPEVSLRESGYRGPGRMQVVADTRQVEQVLDFLGIDDVEVPAGLHGKVATLSVPAIVRLRYANDSGAELDFFQARSPEISLPDGVDIAHLAEIGLRVLGFGAAEAKQFSRSVDWRTTMLVPIPPGDTRFKQVTINGNPGLHIQRLHEVLAEEAGRKTVPRTEIEQVLMWSADGMVFGFTGDFRPESVLQMAYSVR